MSVLFNAGKGWTGDMVSALKADFNAGYGLEALCRRHGRTPNAVVTRLQCEGLLALDGYRSYHRVNPDPWALVSELRHLTEELEREHRRASQAPEA
jgi:hypothetical protein